MACTGVKCVVNAACVQTGQGFTCRCEDGFSGDGYVKCNASSFMTDDDDIHIYVIVLILLLFIGLVAVIIYFLCSRRWSDKSDNEPLVPDAEAAYDKKWEMVLTEKDVPPPYSDISEVKAEPTHMTTFFVETEVGTGDGDERVVVKVDEEDFGDEVDVVQGSDNLAYDGIDNPTYDMVDAKDVEIAADEEAAEESGSDDGMKRAVITKVYVPPDVTHEGKTDEVILEGSSDDGADAEAEEGSDEVIKPADEIAESTDETVEELEPIKITFQENADTPNTITATVTTPNANMTINLNINIPKADDDSPDEVPTEEE